MLKYVSKFALDILPSVVATIVGAYIVNHYIAAKPTADAPAAAMSSIDSKKPDARNAAARNGAKPAAISTDVANIPEPGVRAKGISEKTIFERSSGEKPAAEKPVPVVEKPAEKGADKPAETASIPVEVKRPQPAPREKTVAKAAPVVAAPSTAAPTAAAPVEAAVAPEEHRDANDLARAAIERLRGTTEASPRVQEAARAPEAPRVVSAPQASSLVPIRPLPPPIMVSSPAAETFGPTAGPLQTRPSYPATVRIDDPRRPTPPADIPDSRPLDLRAEAADPSTHEHTTVAEDVLSAAKSVFHAVLPK
jgi:hypothetical protein